MAAIQPSTKLNTVQIHLLKMFSRPMSEHDLTEINGLLTDYFAKKVD